MNNSKFRVWDKSTDFFLKNGLSQYLKSEWYLDFNGDMIWSLERFLDEKWVHNYAFKSEDRFIVQKSLGFKDKNGYEIFEGDLVTFYTNGNGIESEFIERAEVWFDNEDLVFLFGRFTEKDILNEYQWGYVLSEIEKESIEIVGNIFGAEDGKD